MSSQGRRGRPLAGLSNEHTTVPQPVFEHCPSVNGQQPAPRLGHVALGRQQERQQDAAGPAACRAAGSCESACMPGALKSAALAVDPSVGAVSGLAANSGLHRSHGWLFWWRGAVGA